MAGQILNVFSKSFTYEQFDALNPDHIAAYVCLKQYGRQHPNLRFYLEDPFLSIPHLMESRISDAHVAGVKGAAESAAATMKDHLARIVKPAAA